MNRLLILLSLLLGLPASASVVYISTPISIPQDFDGVFVNPLTGVTTATQPGDWNTAPWFNPFFGGVYVWTSDLLRPEITGADQVVNEAVNAVIGSSGTFAAGESGSSTHIGAGANQFQLGTPGIIGFTFKATTSGPSFYGWAKVSFSNSGAGSVLEYAYDDTAGTSIPAGFTGSAAPEPGRTVLLMLGGVALGMRRRRLEPVLSALSEYAGRRHTPVRFRPQHGTGV